MEVLQRCRGHVYCKAGYVYVKNGNSRSLRCTQSRQGCPGTAKLLDDDLQLLKPHDHPSNNAEVDKIRVTASLKRPDASGLSVPPRRPHGTPSRVCKIPPPLGRKFRFRTAVSPKSTKTKKRRLSLTSSQNSDQGPSTSGSNTSKDRQVVEVCSNQTGKSASSDRLVSLNDEQSINGGDREKRSRFSADIDGDWPLQAFAGGPLVDGPGAMEVSKAEPDQTNAQLLVDMGFVDEAEVRQALRLAKNDINEAIGYLTRETPGLEETDTVSGSLPSTSSKQSEASDSTITNRDNLSPSSSRATPDDVDSSNSLEFPTTHLYELESRVFVNVWSVPYGKSESLGRCLSCSVRLAKEKLMDTDDSCRRFLDRCLPACFEKLLNSNEVNKWTAEIQEGIVDMIQLLVELVAARLDYLPICIPLMSLLTSVFDCKSNYQQKNRHKNWNQLRWEEKFGADRCYGVPSRQSEDPYGFLANAVNYFALRDGFRNLAKHFDNPELNAQDMFHLTHPFSVCTEFLNPDVVTPILEPCIDVIISYVDRLNDADLRTQSVAGCVTDLLVNVCYLTTGLGIDKYRSDFLEKLRLDFILRLLKVSHFGARMQALREVSKLLDALADPKPNRFIIQSATISAWLTANSVLSLALEGNIDQAQYCERLRTLLAFVGPRLSCAEISKIWALRRGRAAVAVDNVYHIVAQAAAKFARPELDHLMGLIEKSWESEEDRARERTIGLLCAVGSDCETSMVYTQDKERYGTHRSLIPTYVQEFMWRQRYGGPNTFKNIVEQVRQQYPEAAERVVSEAQVKTEVECFQLI